MNPRDGRVPARHTVPVTGTFALLGGNRPFRALWSARATSYLGDSMGLVALLLYTQRSAGTAIAVALLLLAGDFVPGLFGPFTGTVGDRFDVRKVMVDAS